MEPNTAGETVQLAIDVGLFRAYRDAMPGYLLMSLLSVALVVTLPGKPRWMRLVVWYLFVAFVSCALGSLYQMEGQSDAAIKSAAALGAAAFGWIWRRTSKEFSVAKLYQTVEENFVEIVSTASLGSSLAWAAYRATALHANWSGTHPGIDTP